MEKAAKGITPEGITEEIVVTTEEIVAGGALRRVILVLTVATLMALMMVASVSPASAKALRLHGDNGQPNFSGDVNNVTSGSSVLHQGSAGSCSRHDNGKKTGGGCI